MISFKPLTKLNRGDILNTLRKLYHDYKKIDIDLYLKWEKDWQGYDEFVFDNPDTVGRAGFSTFINDIYVGFCSWNPTQAPEKVIVGHNGILPEFRGNNLGKQQIKEMLKRFRIYGYKNIIVSTGDHDFFIPAQKMYLKCGFKEINREIRNDYPIIEYGLIL